MAASTMASAGGVNSYRVPAVTGLANLVDGHAQHRPGATALIVTEERVHLSYRVLADLADDVAAQLADTGLRPADMVGLVCANTVEFVAALLGVARAGLVAVPLDPALPRRQLAARLAALGVQAVLAGPSARDGWPEVPSWPVRVEVFPAGTAAVTLETGARVPQRHRGAADEFTGRDALVLFTAGTTDRAKMVPLTHANVAAAVTGICGTYELGTVDGTVAVMPLFHGHGLLASLLASLASGGRVLLPARGRFSAHTFWDDVRAAGATWFSAVPTIHEILLERAAREYPGQQVVPLRFVRSCSAPLNTATARALERTLGAPMLDAYGMTETAHQAASEPLPQHGALKPGSVGRATGVELRTVGVDGSTCPPGTEGEVWVRGTTVARGYLADPAETAHSFVDGWFRSGDLGLLDADGYLFLTGRIKNLINRGGEKIAPEHVEDILAGCPGVAEAAVFAIPDAIYGERVGAAVVASGDEVTTEQILRHCRERLPAFEVPDRLEVVAALPHTAKGGLDRAAVEAQYAH